MDFSLLDQFSLLKHQSLTVDFNEKNPYSINALDQGLGKTLVATETARRFSSRALVVCPSYLKTNWKMDIRKFYGDGPIVTIFEKGKDIYPVFDSDFVVVSYSLLQKAPFLFQWADILICDEAHFLKEFDTKRTQFVHDMVFKHKVPRLHLLTGTPIQNRVGEFYSLLCLVYYDPKFQSIPEFLRRFPNFDSFARTFSHRREYTVKVKNFLKKLVKYEGIKNVKMLKEYMKGRYIRFDKSELDLKEPLHKEVFIKDTDNPELIAAFEEFNKKNDSVMSDVKRKAAIEKVPFTVKHCKDLINEGVGKLVVYSDHVDSAEKIADKLGVKAITGTVPMKKRNEIYKNFLEDDGEEAIVATISSFNTGVNLIVANHMVFNDIPWVPGELDQAKDRINRIGQTKVPTYHFILGSIQDQKILTKLKSKKRVIKKVV